MRLFWALGLAVAVFCALLILTRDVPLRGGYDNEHCFTGLSFGFFTPHDWKIAVAYNKELSPLAGISFVDILSGQRLEAIAVANKVLWPVCAFLLGAALLELGAGVWGAVLGAGLFGFNFLSMLNAYTFSTTNWNLFFILCCLLSACRLVREDNSTADWVWYCCSSCLVLTARFEFFPVLLPPLFAAARSLFAASFRRRVLLLLAVWLSFCACWAFNLRRLVEDTMFVPRVSALFANTSYQLGLKNLSVQSGLVPVFWGMAGLAAMLVCCFFIFRRIVKGSGGWVIPAWLLVWIIYFGVIFKPLDLYPLHFIRHQLYFFIAFCLFAGWSAGMAWRRFGGRKVAAAALCLFFVAYASAGVRTARSYNTDLRTNDIECQFLLTARRNWPHNCRIVGGSVRRGGLLRKYFPYAEVNAPSEEGSCLLFYKGVDRDIITDPDGQDDGPEPGVNERLDVDFSSPWLEQKFSHRFYTTFFGIPGKQREERNPIPLTLGIYPARLRKSQ